MKKIYLFATLLISLYACDSAIKNENASIVVEKGTEVPETQEKPVATKVMTAKENNEPKDIAPDDLIGYYVGFFRKDDNKLEKEIEGVYIDGILVWNKENKINISIDEIKDTLAIGHSVVAGNDRPF
ncbi:MAG: hypothetical protein WBA74_13805, partial [Cyclobacteriaceae bacterium]